MGLSIKGGAPDLNRVPGKSRVGGWKYFVKLILACIQGVYGVLWAELQGYS